MTPIGPIVLFGSGETSPSAQRIHHAAMRRIGAPVRAAVLETPAGFEPNSAQVASSVADYLKQRLHNFNTEVEIVPARRFDGPYSTDSPALAAPILRANYIFMGPGSPTYAVRHLRGRYIWYSMLAQHRLGAALCFSSAAAVAVSRHALPVYEIYKVGEDLHWQPGLDFFAAFGLSLVVVPHWNNRDGGADLDTSHCYMGQARFQQLLAMLPTNMVVLGIEENTGVVIEPQAEVCTVVGAGAAIILRDGGEVRHPRGGAFSTLDLGEWRRPNATELGTGEQIPPDIWQLAQQGAMSLPEEASEIPADVHRIVEEREDARRRRDWGSADALRARLGGLGWQVQDTEDGPLLTPLPPHRTA